jgi:hypothetical protein
LFLPIYFFIAQSAVQVRILKTYRRFIGAATIYLHNPKSTFEKSAEELILRSMPLAKIENATHLRFLRPSIILNLPKSKLVSRIVDFERGV